MKSLIVIISLLLNISFLQAKEKSLFIIAKINKEIITNYDLQQRLDLILKSSKIKLNKANKRQIYNQIREILINENIQKIHAKKYQIEITNRQIYKAISEIAQKNKLTYKQFKKKLQQNKMNIEAFKEQIRAQLLWREIILTLVRPNIKINELEVDEYIEANSKEGANYEYQYLTINIPANNIDEFDVAKNTAAKYYKMLLNEKIKFSDLATQFSQDKEQKINWIATSQLDPEIENQIKELEKVEISKPFQTSKGYKIIKLIDKRQISKQARNNIKNKIFASSYKVIY